MKTKKQLLKELEAIGVFIYKNGEYLCAGYEFEITIHFCFLHTEIRSMAKMDNLRINLDSISIL